MCRFLKVKKNMGRKSLRGTLTAEENRSRIAAAQARERLASSSKPSAGKTAAKDHRVYSAPSEPYGRVRAPDRVSEFEVQAWLYAALKSLGFDVRGEVVVYTGDERKGFKVARFDLVIFGEDGFATEIIEVKADGRSSGPSSYSRQRVKYKAFGVKLSYVVGMSAARRYIDQKVRDNRLSPRWEMTFPLG